MHRTERHQVLPKHLFAAIRREKPQIQVSRIVVESAAMDAAGVYARLATRPEGLTADEAGRASCRIRPQRAGQGPAGGNWQTALARGDQSAGDSARGAGDHLVCHRRRPGRDRHVADDRSGRGSETHPGSQGRQRGGQAQGHDLGHGDRRPRRHAAGSRRLATGARRRGEARRGGHDPRRRAHASWPRICS